MVVSPNCPFSCPPCNCPIWVVLAWSSKHSICMLRHFCCVYNTTRPLCPVLCKIGVETNVHPSQAQITTKVAKRKLRWLKYISTQCMRVIFLSLSLNTQSEGHWTSPLFASFAHRAFNNPTISQTRSECSSYTTTTPLSFPDALFCSSFGFLFIYRVEHMNSSKALICDSVASH